MNSSSLQNHMVESAPLNINDEMLNRIGQVTRALHENLRGLGLDKVIEQIAKDMPDACERLHYVARMTEQSAQRVLNATDLAMPIQASIASESALLKQNWQRVKLEPSLKAEYNETVEETLTFLTLTEKQSLESKALLMDIMMAQDFQDLTGQVIKKIIALTQDLENQLVQVLVDFSPAINKKESSFNQTLINGPQVSIHATDSFANQQQVDDLLDDLGF
ncbi:protein phosphatase CheZ [Methylotenera sp.]|uniref:protein phosphatase CheZ n=1 Tax=Methylotenera sp. TaxID=2051956 RepID=UPI00248A0A67|nr:protein phosphatase CheZ [Methylotenera sp.]MDI1361815.1 protein phosphatase CheZ [Methylotenera sp.]